MNQITTISNDAKQTIYVTLSDDSVVTLDIRYLAAIQRWGFSVSHDTLTVNGQIICVSPNMLRQWRKIAAFGLACMSTDGVDPILPDDFVNGRCVLYVLSASEVESVETDIIGVVA